jgi:CRP/FNR family transcriptional regulator, cyclic AMP receptor protein
MSPPAALGTIRDVTADSTALEVLRAVSLFAALDEAEMRALANRTELRSYDPGQMLFAEGDPCAGMYMVASGRVRIFKTSINGREQVLALDGPPNSIAELPVFDGGPYPASAQAVEPARLLFISRRDFRALCLQHPEIGLKVLQVVGSRLRRLVGIIEELSFTTVRSRLISWLLREADASPQQDKVVLTSSHHEIAAEIGTVRELVSRNLARLQSQGLIRMDGREITIADRAELEADLASAP